MSHTPNKIAGQYNGEKGGFFMLTCITTALTIVTLGIYRFWAKSRVRRYVWSATAPNNDPMEYTGTGIEKFIGFLIAMVFLAIYLGLTQLGLSFVGLSLMDISATDPDNFDVDPIQFVGPIATFVFIIPLVLFARYRGRRYMLSRTRWRGLRFGMDQGAIGFALRGMLYGLLTLLSLGLLWPLMTFKLEKYMTDRTWYGDAQFEQEGSWTELYRSFVHLLLGVLALIILPAISAVTDSWAILVLYPFVFIYAAVGLVFYRVDSFRRMARNKVVDDAMTFEATPETGFVVKTYVLGSLLTSLILFLASLPIGLVTVGLAMSGNIGPEGFDPATIMDSSGVAFAGIALTVFVYFGLILLSNACFNAFILQPIYGHFVEKGTLINAKHLDAIEQRAGDKMPDAEGFADALDVGGAF